MDSLFFWPPLGLYGLMSYAVTRRTSEIGARMTLGALPADVLRLILHEVSLLLAVGIVVGIPAAVVASRLITGMVYGLSPAGAVITTLASSILVLTGIALFAGYWPARRASHIDPMEALRAE
ncbi:MAG: FtsX-like permease family protein [Bryobacteraceae bacterium]